MQEDYYRTALGREMRELDEKERLGHNVTQDRALLCEKIVQDYYRNKHKPQLTEDK